MRPLVRVARTIPAATLLTLLFSASAAASPTERIVNGQPADQGEYPAQGFLLVDTNPGPGESLAQCGGTLVGSRQFLTAAHCAVDNADAPLPPQNFNVFLGEVDQINFSSARHFVTTNTVHEAYDGPGHRNDLAMMTLSQPVSFEPLRVVEPEETSLWAPGVPARIIGWGTTSFGGSASDVLLEANVPMVSDSACTSAYGGLFDATTMVCAADSQAPFHDTCQGDSGGPLMTPDRAEFALVGVVSWGIGCADGTHPGVYARIGQGALNTWVLEKLFAVDIAQSVSSPTPGQSVVFSITHVHHPTSTSGFSTFAWDLDGNGSFETSGSTATRAFDIAGTYRVGVKATDPDAEFAIRHRTVTVGAAPTSNPTPTPTSTSTPVPSSPTPTPAPPVVTPLPVTLASLIVSRSPLVDRRGRFGIRVNFSALAPAGKTAVVTVRRGASRLGSVKVKVRRGESVRARVLLTRSGLRRLRRARKLKVTLRLVLGTTVQTKTVLLRLKS